jgi:NAD(P)-dependent dehydrogenase (short-subunit alcohol dehydrogenase family)
VSDVVIVTGATGNLGAAVCRVLACRGARLVCVDHGAGRLDPFVGTLPSTTDILPIGGIDLAETEQAGTVVRKAMDRFGTVTALINTVGGYRAGAVADESHVGHWDDMMRLNARTAVVISGAVLPMMRRNGYGRIVHVSAQPALKSGKGLAAYGASKAAVIRLVEAIAAEHRHHGVTANCILPATIDTPQNRAAMPDAKTDQWVPPEAIARLAAWLTTPEGGVVTGAAIPATGPATTGGQVPAF